MSLAEVVSVGSVEMGHHLLLGQGLEVVNVKTLCFQSRTSVRGDDLGVQFGSDGEFCGIISFEVTPSKDNHIDGRKGEIAQESKIKKGSRVPTHHAV